nr:META domain-containing protein [uncultured Sphingomonas sp.]
MKTILAIAPLALALSACSYYNPNPEPYPPYPGPGPAQPAGEYRAVGTEPFWDLTIGQEMVFTDRGNNVRVAQQTPPVQTGYAGEMYNTTRIRANIVHAQCSDGMSDRTYPDKVQVWIDGREYNGCGAPASYYGQVGESGYPNGMPAPTLSETNWRVVAINGQQVPAQNFYMNFQPDRLSAKFGCNSLGAGYSQSSNRLNVGAVMATRMACPDMSMEDAGSRILAQPLTISGPGDRVTLSNSAGSIDLVRAR